jgi:hypothetical protein
VISRGTTPAVTRRSRRGSQAVEVALLLPVLVAFFAGVVDLAQYLIIADGVVAAVGEGARAGAASKEEEDPLAEAARIAQISWTNADLPGQLELATTLQGAPPDQWIVVEGSVPYSAWFGFVAAVPDVVTYRGTVRLVTQRD